MKKSDITRGEWYVNELPSDGVTIETREFVICRNVLKGNARAISAVPNMIDALIEARKALKMQKRDLAKRELRSYKVNNAIDTIEQALSKAGCKEE